MSYFFIAIIWINHHHLWRFVASPILKLMWINFTHLFLVSFLPFATARSGRTRLASSPMMFYAGLFVAIDIAYNFFERQVMAAADPVHVPARMRRIARRRSLTVLAAFTAAMLVASVAPFGAFALICAALVLHVRPDLSCRRR